MQRLYVKYDDRYSELLHQTTIYLILKAKTGTKPELIDLDDEIELMAHKRALSLT